MIRNFDLSMDHEVLAQHLNDPHLKLIQLKVSCSETGYTAVTARFAQSAEAVERRRSRYLRRFLMFNGRNHDLDALLGTKSVRLIRKYEFMTEQGMIIVVDYQV